MNYQQHLQIIEAPSILGLRSTGVDLLPGALKNAGLLKGIYDRPEKVVEVPTLNDIRTHDRDPETQVMNGPAIAAFSQQLAGILRKVRDQRLFPVVLGGDCSILIGTMLSLKEQGDYGLVFIDAHADYYQPPASTAGEVADMDLAIVAGGEPAILSNINGLRPYVKEEHIIHIAQRDQDEANNYGSQDIHHSHINCFDLNTIRNQGMAWLTRQVIQVIDNSPIDGFWIHFDADVLNDELMPAVDYRLPGGLALEEASSLLRRLLRHPKAAGITITIFNPEKDEEGQGAMGLARCLNQAFNNSL